VQTQVADHVLGTGLLPHVGAASSASSALHDERRLVQEQVQGRQARQHAVLSALPMNCTQFGMVWVRSRVTTQALPAPQRPASASRSVRYYEREPQPKAKRGIKIQYAGWVRSRLANTDKSKQITDSAWVIALDQVRGGAGPRGVRWL